MRRFFFVFISGFFLCAAASFPVFAETQAAEAAHTPWSGYWWPYSIGGLANGMDYRGEPAPLQKYDMLLNQTGGDSAAGWYKDNLYDPDAPSWHGHCGDWAMASIIESIDFYPSVHGNILFRVGDKKGLLTLAHNADVLETANGEYPEVFHEWLLTYIKDLQIPFSADLFPGEEIWNYPIYRYEMESQIQESIESVKVKVYFAFDLVEPDYVGTMEMHRNYTYDLYLDEEGAILYGEWTGKSELEHPERLLIPVETRTSCPNLDYPTVKNIALAQDDELENENDFQRLLPGFYNLVLMNPDMYQLDIPENDTAVLRVQRLENSSQLIFIKIYDGKGDIIHDHVIGKTDDRTYTLSGNPPYEVHVMQNDYQDPNIYTISYDLIGSLRTLIPYVPKQGMWSGFALCNPNHGGTGEIMMISYDQDGFPIQTILGPFALDAGEKFVFFFDELSYRPWEKSRIQSLMLVSRTPIEGMNLFGYSREELAGFKNKQASGNYIVLPDSVSMSYTQVMRGSIHNLGTGEKEISITNYTGTGNIWEQSTQMLEAGSRMEIKNGQAPFYNVADGGWFEIKGDTNSYISGFQYLSETGSIDTLFALTNGGKEYFIPHVPESDSWETILTLINTSDSDNIITIHPMAAYDDSGTDLQVVMGPKEKQVIDIGKEYGFSAADPLFHTALSVKAQNLFTGYYSYRETTPGKDKASMALISQSGLSNTLILPHYPGTQTWWTGVGIFNPTPEEAVVQVESVDFEGNPAEHQQIILAPGEYEIFFAADMISQDVPVSFFRFRESSGNSIGGFYLYGNRVDGIPSTNMLFGANM